MAEGGGRRTSLHDTSASGCGTGSPCIDATFGPTAASTYWSSTSSAGFAGFAWFVDFLDGSVSFDYKLNGFFVRAVRGDS